MVILTDLCVHKDILSSLREAGFKVISAQEAKLQSASDSAIYNYVLKKSYILLTFDKDFGNVLRFDITESLGVVVVYIEDMNKDEIIKNTTEVFKNFSESKFKGKLFIVEKNRIRIWPK